MKKAIHTIADLKLDRTFIRDSKSFVEPEPLLLYTNLYIDSMKAAPSSYISHYIYQMGYNIPEYQLYYDDLINVSIERFRKLIP